jgi:peptide/nickel transport system substrate-binding protein
MLRGKREDSVNLRRSLLAFTLALALTLALTPPASTPVTAAAAPEGRAAAPEGRAAAPDGQITFAVHVTLAPTWFDPAEVPGVITPFLTLYALHDALVKPMPDNPWTPSLAESWTASKDGLTYEFVLRKGLRFHNGDAVSAEDVKFSFERYKGGGATTLKARVAAVEIVDAQRVRFRMKQPWPDFMTFYATPATGAAWIVPKKYVERVGDDGFKRAPIGAGPYRFVSFNPGVELTVEAYEGYWRKTPSVKRLVFRSVPDESTRVAMLKRGEADVVYSIRGPNGEEVKRTPGLTLKATYPTFTQWVVFTEQWDPKSPWADRRVRLAANLAIDRKGFTDAEYLGFGKPAPSIIPRDYEFYWPAPAYPFDPARAKQLLAEAGYPRGFDAVEVATDIVYAPEAEAVINGLQTVGIRARLRPMERAGFYKADQDKAFKHLVRVGSGTAGNAATRIEAFVISGGIRSYGGYPDIDALFRDQVSEMDKKRREAMLHKIQQMMYERAMFAPIVEPPLLSGVGARLAETPTIPGHPYVSPYEDLKLKAR